MTNVVQAIYSKHLSRLIVWALCLVIFSLFVNINVRGASLSTIPALHSGYDLDIDAPAAVLMDVTTGIVIYDKNMHERHYPASTTKIMTALLVLEHFAHDLDTRVPFSWDAVHSIPRNTSHIAMNDNETLSVREALYALMLESANEVANALAELVGGSMDDFALMMTARAIELGARNTNFVNAHGLHHPDHYTTAFDLALIMRRALDFPVLSEIISTVVSEIPPTERQPLPRPLLNTNHMIRPASQHYNPNVVGGKTGFTDEARHTLVTYGRLRNMGLVAVVLRQERALNFRDTTTLLDFGFENFENVQVFDRNSLTQEIPVLGQGETVRLIGERSLTMSLPIGVREHIQVINDIPEFIEQDIQNGDLVGSVSIMYRDLMLREINIFAETTPVIFVPEIYTPMALPDDFNERQSFLGVLSTIIQVLIVLVAALAGLILIIHFKSRQYKLRRFRAAREKHAYYYRYNK